MRCAECGATNTDPLAERCRLCMCLLPGAAKRRADRLSAATAGAGFNAMVETEVEVWQELEKRGDEGPRSRRPTEDESNGRRSRWKRRDRRDDAD